MVNYDGRVSGTQNRTKVSVSLDINSDCDYIVIGGELRGSGKASFDGFTLECDGKPLIETEAYSNNPKMIDWLNKYKKPLPDYISDTLYKSLNLNFLNGYKYIALGENTHGSSEEFIAKGEMIKSLILHNGVRVIAFELGLAEGDIVDKCLQNNCLGISEAWRKVSSFPWDNTEVLNFLKWVADYNSKVSVNDRVHFVGMDIQTESLATNRLKNYATATSNKKLLYKLESLSKLQKSSYIYMYGNGFRWLKKSAAKKFIRAGKVVLHQT